MHQDSDRCFVEEVFDSIDGSPNPLAGRVREGDELVYVEGRLVREAGTWSKLRVLLGKDALEGRGTLRLTFAAGIEHADM